MNDKNTELLKYYLIILTRTNSDIDILLGSKYSFFDIKIEIRDMVRRKLIDDSTGYMKVTTLGLKEEKRIKQKYQMANIESLVVPMLIYDIEKMDIDEVYLP